MADSTHKREKLSLSKENSGPDEEKSAWKLLRLNLKKSKQERFLFLSAEDVVGVKKVIAPKNTKKCTEWAVCAFSSWLTQRNERNADDKFYEDILLTNNLDLLCKWLCFC